MYRNFITNLFVRRLGFTKNAILLSLCLSFLSIACNSDGDNIATDNDNLIKNSDYITAKDDNLVEIGNKLRVLKIFSLDSFEVLDPLDISFSLNKNNPKKKHLKKQDACFHEITDELTTDEITVKSVIKYFDLNENPITSCDISLNSLNFIFDQNIWVTGTHFNYFLHQYTLTENSYTLSENSIRLKEKLHSEIDGNLNFNEDTFSILEGSYIDILLEYSSDNLDESDLDNLASVIDVKFNIGFKINEEDYYFKIEVNEEDLYALIEDESYSLQKEYPLLNAKNEKIGTVQHTSNEETEIFTLYNLEGNLIP